MAFKDKATKAESVRMSGLRAKEKAGKRLTQAEQAKLADWDRRHPRKRPRKSEAPTAGAVLDEKHDQPPQVQTGLPGGGGESAGPPPLSVDPSASAAAGAAQSSTSGPAATSTGPSSSATTGASSKSGAAPAMSKEEAEAQGTLIANMATQVLSEFNAYNGRHGMPMLGQEFLMMFHLSCKRLAVRYGAAINEETYDQVIVFGSAGFVGFQSWRVYQLTEEEKKKSGAIDAKLQEGKAANGHQQQTPKPAGPAPGAVGSSVINPGSGLRVVDSVKGFKVDPKDTSGPPVI